MGLPRRTATRHNLANDPYGDLNHEGRVVTAEYEDFYLVTVYTPNVKGDLSRLGTRRESWDPAFLAYVKSLKKRKAVVICGDLNVAHGPDDLANPKANEGNAGYTIEERQGFENLLRAGFVDSFRIFKQGNGHYTWWSFRSAARERNVGWRIDYFLVSEDLLPRIVAAEIHADLLGSDHCPVSITLDL
jgi:exodeoxyribonuclease-3